MSSCVHTSMLSCVHISITTMCGGFYRCRLVRSRDRRAADKEMTSNFVNYLLKKAIIDKTEVKPLLWFIYMYLVVMYCTES